VERKRRERIDHCLEQLREIILSEEVSARAPSSSVEEASVRFTAIVSLIMFVHPCNHSYKFNKGERQFNLVHINCHIIMFIYKDARAVTN